MDQQLHNLSVEVVRVRDNQKAMMSMQSALKDQMELVETYMRQTNAALVKVAHSVSQDHVDVINRLVALKEQLNQIDMTTCLSLNDRSKGGE